MYGKSVRAISTALGLILLMGTPVKARVVIWSLSNVAFDDGGTASGSFGLDADTLVVSEWNVSVSGGDTGSFPPFTYDPSTSSPQMLFSAADTITFEANSGPPNRRQLRLTPSAALTNGGGEVALNPSNRGVECFNCSPFRPVSAGSLIGVPLPVEEPEPAPLLDPRGLLFLVVALGSIAWLRLRRSAARRS